MNSRRNFLKGGTVGMFAGAFASPALADPPAPPATPKPSASASDMGVVVSNQPGRGDFNTADFDSDGQAIQQAYDTMVTTLGLPKTLILDASAGPLQMDRPLDIWQSHCRITSTGGPTLVPADAYKGPLIQSTLRKETQTGEDGCVTDVIMDNLWLNGRHRAIGIKLRNIQLSTIHDIHVRNTDGPGLWLSEGCIENLFSDLILSDRCGNMDQPALLIETEAEQKPKGNDNITVNSTHFSGVMIHFPDNQALRIARGNADIQYSRRQRKIQFTGCMFHGHDRATKPVVTLSDAYEINFVGTQMLRWSDKGAVIQIGEKGSRWPVGITMISHCHILAQPRSTETVGIEVVNVEENAPSLALFGNCFGSTDARLGHAVDWGPQKNKLVAWAANAVNVKGEPHIGVMPADADVSPFA